MVSCVAQVPVVFGCETRETGEIFNQEADGILGLGNSPISLVNQARAATALLRALMSRIVPSRTLSDSPAAGHAFRHLKRLPNRTQPQPTLLWTPNPSGARDEESISHRVVDVM